MAAKLVAEDGILKGLVLSLEEGEQWVIGRDPDSAQLLVEDPEASRKHLLCRTSPEGIVIENLSDTNPALINGESLAAPYLLKNGDAVQIGSGTFRFYSEDEAQITGELEPEEEAPSEEKVTEEAPEEEVAEEPITEEPITEEPVSEELKEEAAPTEPPEEAPAEEIAEEPVTVEKEEEEEHDSLYDEVDEEKNILAEIDFDLMETGRWLLKVIGGPNNGAEFSMLAGQSYLIGTDPNTCDIVFHDTSVSRQHGRITVGDDDVLTVEDLKSRNSTLVDGEKLEGKMPLEMNALVSMGTTSFIVYDREGDMQTIISPLLPDIVRALQEKEEEKKRAEAEAEEATKKAAEGEVAAEPPSNALSAFMLIGILTGLFVIVGIGMTTLFQSEPILLERVENPEERLQHALAPFPSITASFNKQTGQLLLVGHVLTATDRNQMMYNLQGLTFINKVDDTGIVIDEYVWQETNQVLGRHPKWKGINIHSPSAGKYILSGYLETRLEFEELSDYITANFPYLDLLEKQIIVEEDVENSVDIALQNIGIRNVTAQMLNGQLTLRGGVPADKASAYREVLSDFHNIPGVRNVKNFVQEIAPGAALVNISDRYSVTGYSKRGASINIVINGKILTKNDLLDGMRIMEIRPNMILLEKDDVRYRIDYSQ